MNSQDRIETPVGTFYLKEGGAKLKTPVKGGESPTSPRTSAPGGSWNLEESLQSFHSYISDDPGVPSGNDSFPNIVQSPDRSRNISGVINDSQTEEEEEEMLQSPKGCPVTSEALYRGEITDIFSIRKGFNLTKYSS